MRRTRPARIVGLLVALAAPWPARAVDEPAAARLFREKVAPVLEARCVSCHSGAEPKGGLGLATAAALARGGDSGPAVAAGAGAADDSALVEAVTGDPPSMP